MNIPNTNDQHQDSLSPCERLALWMTNRVGSMAFFFMLLGWCGSWLAWNTLGPLEGRFDPFPGFVLWLFLSNILQLILLPLLMVGQNLQGRHAELRAEHEYQISLQNAQETRQILAYLRHLHRMTRALNEKAGDE